MLVIEIESKSVYGDADEEYEGKFDNKMRDSYGHVFKTDIQNQQEVLK